MASKRNLKKDVNYLTGEFLADCMSLLVLYGEQHEEKLSGIMQDLATSRNKLVETVNHPIGYGERIVKTERAEKRKVNGKQNKAVISQGFDSFLKKLDEGYTVLGDLVEKA